MARIFFKKEGQKPSAFATLGLITAGLAFIALVIAGPVFRIDLFGQAGDNTANYGQQIKVLWVSFRLIAVAAVFTIAGILHGRLSSRARASWRAFIAAIMVTAMAWPVGQMLYDREYGPELHDISTRPETMMRFRFFPERQYETGSAADTLGGRLDENYQTKLHRAYPGLGSLPYPGTVRETTEAAVSEIRELGWDIAETDLEEGRIEALYTSPWFGFRTLILVEVRAIDAVSFLDIRTVSEVGHTDMGTGFRLISALKAGLNERS